MVAMKAVAGQSKLKMFNVNRITLLCLLSRQLACAAAEHANDMPEAKFTDVTSVAGITFVHNNGAYGDKLLPETMGGGVAFFDADADGDQDLLFVSGTQWPGKLPAAGAKSQPSLALYVNDGKGKF